MIVDLDIELRIIAHAARHDVYYLYYVRNMLGSKMCIICISSEMMSEMVCVYYVLLCIMSEMISEMICIICM